jgi:hypothetical protein
VEVATRRKSMSKRFPLRALLLGLLCIFVFHSGAFAQKAFPTRQINYMICFNPGGQSDRVARLQQPHLDKLFKQKVIIDYKVEGGGALGWKELAHAKPDCYTVAGFNIPHIILQPMQQEVGYKTEQIIPVALFQRTPLALAVLNTSSIKTFQEFVDQAKKNPGKVTVGGSGTFPGYHMAALRLTTKRRGTRVQARAIDFHTQLRGNLSSEHGEREGVTPGALPRGTHEVGRGRRGPRSMNEGNLVSGRSPGNHGYLQIGVVLATRVDDVVAPVDQPFILRHPVLVRAVTLNIEAQTLAFTEQGAGRQKRDLHRHDPAGLQFLFALELLDRLKVRG